MNQRKEQAKQVKKCNVCGEVKPLSEFYKIDASREGRRPDCKDCRRKYQGEHNKRPEVRKRIRAYWQEYQNRPEIDEKLNEYYREYNQKPEVKKRKSEYAKEWATRARRRAYYSTTRAVRRGELEPASALLCVDCGKQAKQYFYENYEIPPKITPLCVSCHRKRVSEKGKVE